MREEKCKDCVYFDDKYPNAGLYGEGTCFADISPIRNTRIATMRACRFFKKETPND